MSFFKTPKTHQEKAASSDPEIIELVRTKRLAQNLPSDWDDKYPTDERTWKRHRKTQYKCKAA